MMMTTHVYNDGLGEVRVYATLPGCTCDWCKNQRGAAAKKFGQKHGDGEALLMTYAKQIAAKQRISLSAAIAQARKEFPNIAAAAYSADSSGTGDPNAGADRAPERAGAKLDALAKAREREAGITYSAALREVMRENPRLADDYERLGQHSKQRNK